MLNGLGGFGLECVGFAGVAGNTAANPSPYMTDGAGRPVVGGVFQAAAPPAHGGIGAWSFQLTGPQDTSRLMPIAIAEVGSGTDPGFSYTWSGNSSLIVFANLNVAYKLIVLRLPNP